MDPFNQTSRIIVTCHRGLAPWLELELREGGAGDSVAFHGGVSLDGTLNDCIRLNLELRTASQVMFSLRQFRCTGPEELYRGVANYPWEDWIDPDGYFTVHSNVVHPSMRSGMFANVKVKDGVVDRIRRKAGRRPDSGAEPRGVGVYLFWRNDRAEIFLDTSGETLAKHGYRRIPGAAPMLESLASATLLASRWDRQSAFINPMCGSGTLAIEAALMATGRAPGLFRDRFAFMHLLGYEPATFQRCRDAIQKKNCAPPPGLVVVASDLDPAAVDIARKNAAVAGVDQLIQFSVCDFAETPVPEGGPGIVMFNPEYGERLGETTELEATYTRIGDFLKHRCSGYLGYVFTGNQELAKKIGLRPKRRIEFQSARLDCRLLEFELYSGSRRARAQVSAASSDDHDEQGSSPSV